jgi:signal peptidase II
MNIMKNYICLLGITFLVSVDQLIKLIINKYYFNEKFNIIPSLLEFKPTFNTKSSYVNFQLSKYCNIDIGETIHIIFSFIFLFLLLFLYDIMKTKEFGITILKNIFIWGCSGLLCVLITYLFWDEGCLDYIYLKPFSITFDLKDMYIDLLAISAIIYLYYYHRQIDQIKWNDVKEYFKQRITLIKKRIK